MRQDGQEVPRRRGIADIGTVGQREKQHLRNEQTLRTRRIAQGRQEECSPDRKQRFPPEAENRHSQQKHRIGHLVRKSRRLGEEQGGAAAKSRVVRANMREVRCIVSGKIISGKSRPSENWQAASVLIRHDGSCTDMGAALALELRREVLHGPFDGLFVQRAGLCPRG